MILSAFVIGCATIVLTAASSNGSTAWHPYFKNVVAAAYDDGRETIAVDGQSLPHRFSVSVNTPHCTVKEADPIEFVLVLPGDVTIDGLTLRVRTPFYISTTELSNGQFARLRHLCIREYDHYGSDIIVRTRFDLDVPGCDIDRIDEYHGDPQLPALGVDLADAAVVARHLSMNTGMRGRLPGLGEWFRAMRAESDALYYWGNEALAGRRPRERSAPLQVSCELMQTITHVDIGEANPLGLKNMLGNVAELVIPSDVEREILRGHFGPDAPHAVHERHRRLGMALAHHSALAVGGSVQTADGWLNLDIDEFVLTWTGLLGFSQIDERAPLCYHMHWCTGMRLVIDIPLGEWAVVEAPPSEGGAGPD